MQLQDVALQRNSKNDGYQSCAVWAMWKWKDKTAIRSKSRMHVPVWTGTMDIQGVYISMECEQILYWDDTVADMHKDILSTVQTLNSMRLIKPLCINGIWQMKTFVVIIICLTLSMFDVTHQTRPLTIKRSSVGLWVIGWLELSGSCCRTVLFVHNVCLLVLTRITEVVQICLRCHPWSVHASQQDINQSSFFCGNSKTHELHKFCIKEKPW